SILWREYHRSYIKMQLLRIFQSSVTICRSDKIALFLVINLLNLECTIERVPQCLFFSLTTLSSCQRKYKFLHKSSLKHMSHVVIAKNTKSSIERLVFIGAFPLSPSTRVDAAIVVAMHKAAAMRRVRVECIVAADLFDSSDTTDRCGREKWSAPPFRFSEIDNRDRLTYGVREYVRTYVGFPGNGYEIFEPPFKPTGLTYHNIMFEALPKADIHIKNSFQLVDKLKGTHISNEYKLISLDVIFLFTNIPMDLAIDCISEKWTYIAKKCDISKTEFIKAITFILDSIMLVVIERLT
ncbi:hypothetical protein ALC62_01836, partial [Cyphomyrmex costatus]